MLLITPNIRDFAKYLTTNNKQFTAQTQVTQIGGSFYSILLLIGAFGVAICLILVFCSFMVAGGSKKIAEGKKKLLETVVIALAIFSVPAIIAAVFKFGNSFTF